MSLLHALNSYVRVRSFPHRIRSRAALKAWQEKRLRHWLTHDVPKVEAFADLKAARLEDLPVMTKSDLMADFSRYTLARITNTQGWEAFNGPKRIGALTVGASTGTSGNRGLFAISEAERFTWLGAILAKTNSDFWRHHDRIAVMLPIDTPLYDSANRLRRLSLGFFDINDPFDVLAPKLEAFDPTIIVAPPRMLRRVIESALQLHPRRVFSAAEKLEAPDRRIIEAGFRRPLHEIYMATEGLFATTCPHGRLHLAEDCMHFEFEPAGNGLVIPIISDFSRKSQIMARYRMNDLLRLDPSPCTCGSPLMGVAEIIGREDDIFFLPGPDNALIELTPDILRNAVLDSNRDIDDFRLIQTEATKLILQLPARCDPAPTITALHRLFTRHRCPHVPQITHQTIPPNTDGKLRRIRQDWTRNATQARKWISSNN